ncbi:MAG TPA: hypothetical protein VGC35_06070 [Allosphingosinicella sp.]
MSYQVATTNETLQQVPVGSTNDDVTRCVESQEKLERILPQAANLIFAGIFVVYALASRGALSVIVTGVIIFFLAKLAKRVIRAMVLRPSRRVRYDRAADKLRSRLRGASDIAVGPFSWTLGAPGAMGVTRTGELIILDRGHDYVPLQLLPHQIADVRVECDSQQFIQTFHSGRTTVAGFGKSFGMGYTMGGSSTSVASTVNEYFLEIRYQIEKNGAVGTVVVPGGRERRVVEELCATIRRLEA